MSVATFNPKDVRDSFDVKRERSSYACVYYSVQRTNPAIPWPTDAELLEICDRGWDNYLKNQGPMNFGGRISSPSPSSETRSVCVYTD